MIASEIMIDKTDTQGRIYANIVKWVILQLMLLMITMYYISFKFAKNDLYTGKGTCVIERAKQ